jgi:hypothetical protein
MKCGTYSSRLSVSLISGESSHHSSMIDGVSIRFPPSGRGSKVFAFKYECYTLRMDDVLTPDRPVCGVHMF